MSKRSDPVIASCIVMLLGSGVHAQVLWDKARYQMSLSEVKKAVPDVVACNKPASSLGDGSLGLLCKQNILIADEQFKVIFYFKNGALTQVTLQLQGKHDFSAAKLTFDAIADVLRSKYGHELSLKYHTGLLNSASANWASGATNIYLYCVSVSDTPATLNVNYQVRTSQDAERL